MRKLLVALGIVSVAALAGPVAHADPNFGVAVPGSEFVGYATTQISIPKGNTLTFVNLDPAAKHDLVSNTLVSGKHIFESDLISAPGTSDVSGVSKLAKGSYAFHCTLHSVMKGTLTIQ